MPAGRSIAKPNPTSVALVAGNVPLLGRLLDRELTASPAPVSAGNALIDTL
jgi:hypothetical protein